MPLEVEPALEELAHAERSDLAAVLAELNPSSGTNRVSAAAGRSKTFGTVPR